MIPSKEFVKGKHNIGYVDSDFLSRVGDQEFQAKSLPTFQKLSRSMTDAEIENELKPGFCDLGDILAFLDNAPEECKDGYSNIFYTPSFVVDVRWRGFSVEWRVDAWIRGDNPWRVSRRVFSPAAVGGSVSQFLSPEKLRPLYEPEDILLAFKINKLTLEEAVRALRK